MQPTLTIDAVGPSHPKFLELLRQAPPGPRIEFGVLYGDTLKRMAQHNDITIGVDSFEGMGEPTEFDYDAPGDCKYPKGRLCVPYDDVRAAVVGRNVVLIKGWVPAVLDHIPYHLFAFAHVDMDHYMPTKHAIAWLWDKMLPGGILACDDWFPDRTNTLAARAINEAGIQRRPFDGTFDRQAYWRF